VKILLRWRATAVCGPWWPWSDQIGPQTGIRRAGQRSTTIGSVSNAPAAFTLPAAALLLILAVLGAVTAARGWTGTLSRKGRLGVHSTAAVSSNEAFAVANRVAAPVVAGAAILALLLAVVVVALPLQSVLTVVIGVFAVAAVLVLLIAGGVLGEKAARTLPVPARRPNNAASCGGCACGSGGCSGLTRTAAPIDAAVQTN